MTDPHAQSAHAAASEHDTAVHMDAHAALGDDDHGHAEMALGPIDWRAWAMALLGAGSGVIVLAAFWLALS